jgi:hypothetical protein
MAGGDKPRPYTAMPAPSLWRGGPCDRPLRDPDRAGRSATFTFMARGAPGLMKIPVHAGIQVLDHGDDDLDPRPGSTSGQAFAEMTARFRGDDESEHRT